MNFKLKKEAIDFRSELGFGETDSVNLKSLLIKLDVIAVFKSISDSISGMAVKTPVKNFILINSLHSVGRQNFSICHELFHLYKQEGFIPHHCKAGSFDKDVQTEWMADVFASYFLIPDGGILHLIPDTEVSKRDRITIETVLKIENYFGCSRSALLYRLKEMSIITSGKYEELSQNVRRTAKEYGYSTELYEPGNEGLVIGNYGVLAKQLFDKEKISEGHYYSLLSDIGIDLFNSDVDGGSDR
ncbi:MAG TPA: ImmA/IrrE family metallo-endopeptidase [Bacteroidales bacterium]|nr:ImmA/IrrE family metallo-endopeptidase [Bacteroidales bacterium]